jgi:hypothetical protein
LTALRKPTVAAISYLQNFDERHYHFIDAQAAMRHYFIAFIIKGNAALTDIVPVALVKIGSGVEQGYVKVE